MAEKGRFKLAHNCSCSRGFRGIKEAGNQLNVARRYLIPISLQCCLRLVSQVAARQFSLLCASVAPSLTAQDLARCSHLPPRTNSSFFFCSTVDLVWFVGNPPASKTSPLRGVSRLMLLSNPLARACVQSFRRLRLGSGHLDSVILSRRCACSWLASERQKNERKTFGTLLS